MGALEGKVVLVTGGGNGIGRDCALIAAQEGAKVVVNDLGGGLKGGDEGDAGPAEAVAREIRAAGGEAVSNSESVTSFKAVQGMVEQAMDSFGGLHAVINPAGILRDGMFHKMTKDQWYGVINTNLNSLFNMTRPVWEGMRARKFGRVICISSINGQKGQMGQVNYSAAKAGDIGFVKALAQEGARAGITVNSICPGYIATEMVKAIDPAVVEKNILPLIPVGRLGEPEEIARAVVFLAADEAGFITGSTLSANGGQYMI
jgi:acetoacetyl-CoA reductase